MYIFVCLLFPNVHKSCPLTQVVRAGMTFSDKARLLVRLIYEKSAQKFVHFVETLVASETYSELGRRLLTEGNGLSLEVGKELNDERYGTFTYTFWDSQLTL